MSGSRNRLSASTILTFPPHSAGPQTHMTSLAQQVYETLTGTTRCPALQSRSRSLSRMLESLGGMTSPQVEADNIVKWFKKSRFSGPWDLQAWSGMDLVEPVPRTSKYYTAVVFLTSEQLEISIWCIKILVWHQKPPDVTWFHAPEQRKSLFQCPRIRI